MIKKIFVLIFGILLGLSSAPLNGQTKLYKIGIASWVGFPASMQGFKDGIAESGLVEGKNVEFFLEKSGADRDKQKGIAEHFKAEQMDLVYSVTTIGTLIMKRILPKTTPIVFSIVSYPVKVGIIKSFEKSNTNLVGTSNFVEPKSFITLLKIMIPNIQKVAIFRRRNEPNSTIQKNALSRLLKKEDIQFIDVPADSIEELKKKALEHADKVGVFITTQDSLIQGGGEKAIIEVSLDKRIPILSSNKAGIENGATFGPVADFYTIGKLSGEMAAKILVEKIKPTDLKSKLQNPPLILINKKSIELMGITIPVDKLKSFKLVN